MATHSSSESWSGARGADVIDLDKFMRGVRPHRPKQRYQNRNDLVVDNGGLSRQARSSSSSSARAPTPAHHKRYSHDSGVSDGSYVKRRSRPHRRYSIAESAGIRAKREAGAAPSASGSMRAFRAACERTLRDQQRQLARVALLCERLGERRERSETEPTEQTTKSESSELSSSSRSTRDPRRKDKSRAQECKTYKIIMSKLDELNRVFLLRRGASPARRRAPPPPSSASVSVSDKLVATDDRRGGKLVAPRQTVTKRVERRQLVERAVGEQPSERGERTERTERTDRSARLATLQAVNNAYSLDIAPQEAVCKIYPNIATESVVKRGSSNEGSHTTLADARCGFDLDDPIQLYAQAKRLQALHMTSRRARSSAPTATSYARSPRAGGAASGAAGGAGGGAGKGGPTLCALCREYWRAVRGYLAAQVCFPRDDVPCACS